MRYAFLIGCVFIVSGAFAQKQAVLEAFAKYNIDTSILNLNARKNAEQYAFDVKTTTTIEDKQQVSIGKHDPALPEAEQWQLISWNDKAPSNKEVEQFRKTHDPNAPVATPDVQTYKVVQDDGSSLVISYQPDPASLVEDNKFLKGFVTTMYINLKTRRLERSETKSSGPFKIKIFNADMMNSNTSYVYIESQNEYLPLKEEVLIDLKILGRVAETITTMEYSSYKK